MYVYICLHVYIKNIYTHIYMHVCIYIYACMYTNTMDMHIYFYIYTYVYIQTHKHIYATPPLKTRRTNIIL